MPRRQSPLLFKLVDGLQFSFAFVGRMLKQEGGRHRPRRRLFLIGLHEDP